MTTEGTRKLTQPAIELAAGSAGVAAAALGGGPVAGVATASAVGVLGRALEKLFARARERPQAILDAAAKEAQMDPEELAERLAQISGGEELLLKTLYAGLSVADRKKMVVLSRALAEAVQSGDPVMVSFESQLVESVRDLDLAHFEVLHEFTRETKNMWSSGGVENGHLPERELVERLFSLRELLSVLLAGLERHGLVRFNAADPVPPGVSAIGRYRVAAEWGITDYGRRVAHRLATVAQLLSTEPPARSTQEAERCQ